MPGSSEADARVARALIDAHLAGLLVLTVPGLLFYEVGNILICGTARAPTEIIEQELARLHQLTLEVVAVDAAAAARTARLARDLGVTFYDATYLALAESLSCDLVTADAKLARRAARAGRVKLLSQWTPPAAAGEAPPGAA